VGSTEAQVSGSAVASDNAAQLVGGTALIPFGFAAGQLGFHVDIDQSDAQMTVLNVQM